MFMAKIYIKKEDKKHIKEIIFNGKHDSNESSSVSIDNVITFEKKYVEINSYLFSTNIFPNVLIPIIMDYVNDIYTIKCDISNGQYINIKQIINPNGEHILKIYNSVEIGISYDQKHIYMGNKLNAFTTHKDVCHDAFHAWSLVIFFNYFMKKYYGKNIYIYAGQRPYLIVDGDTYYLHTDATMAVARKIENHKELRNIIVIFKILSKLICS